MTTKDTKSQGMEAIAYAAEILNGFEETGKDATIAAWLEDLADEFDTAERERRGMDPRKVRTAVQALIRVARFPPNNAPEIHQKDPGSKRVPFKTLLFDYHPKVGRPTSIAGTEAIFFTVTAVAARFNFTVYENPTSQDSENPKALSAMGVVAKANAKLKLTPNRYSGVRTSYKRGLAMGLPQTDGSVRGTYDKKFANKQAMTETP